MSINDNQIKKIIELRVQGLSLRKIAQEVGVDKKTVLKYSMQFRDEVDSERFSHVQEVFLELQLDRIIRLKELARQKELVLKWPVRAMAG